MNSVLTGVFLIVVLAVVGSLYFLPAIVAALNSKKNVGAIFVLNFFLGWTLVGWVVCLVWSFMVEEEKLANFYSSVRKRAKPVKLTDREKYLIKRVEWDKRVGNVLYNNL